MTVINTNAQHSLDEALYGSFQTLTDIKPIGFMLLVSALFHSMVFLYFGDNSETISEQPLHSSLVISLSKITPEAPPEPEQKTEQSQQTKPEESSPQLVNKIHSAAELSLRKKTEPQLKPLTKSQQQQPKQQQAQNQIENSSDPALLNKSKDEYMQVLVAHLDKHKFYPRSARRRNVEGKVQVSFDLLSNGQITNLHTLSGHPVLQKATMDSIYSALPMPARPEKLLALNTMKIEYSMQYALKR